MGQRCPTWRGVPLCRWPQRATRGKLPHRLQQHPAGALSADCCAITCRVIDGYAGYNRLTRASRHGGEPIVTAPRWAHARRKLREVHDRDGSGIAAEGLRQIADLYTIEAEIKGMCPDNRLAVRATRSAPLVAAFANGWQHSARISRKFRLGERFACISNHWAGLQTLLTGGTVEIDSNPVKNLIRPIALNRRNALFSGHDEGGKAWGRSAPLIETAKVNGIDPFAYLRTTLERIAYGHPQEELEELLPWNFKPSSIQSGAA